MFDVYFICVATGVNTSLIKAKNSNYIYINKIGLFDPTRVYLVHYTVNLLHICPSSSTFIEPT